MSSDNGSAPAASSASSSSRLWSVTMSSSPSSVTSQTSGSSGPAAIAARAAATIVSRRDQPFQRSLRANPAMHVQHTTGAEQAERAAPPKLPLRAGGLTGSAGGEPRRGDGHLAERDLAV